MQQRREEVTKRELYRERKKEKNENKKQRARERTFPFNSFKFVATNRDLICTCVRVCAELVFNWVGVSIFLGINVHFEIYERMVLCMKSIED